MGKIERELRMVTGLPERMWAYALCREVSLDCYCVVRGAAEESLGLRGVLDANSKGLLPDVMSEAIEAAEALGL